MRREIFKRGKGRGQLRIEKVITFFFQKRRCFFRPPAEDPVPPSSRPRFPSPSSSSSSSYRCSLPLPRAGKPLSPAPCPRRRTPRPVSLCSLSLFSPCLPCSSALEADAAARGAPRAAACRSRSSSSSRRRRGGSPPFLFLCRCYFGRRCGSGLSDVARPLPSLSAPSPAPRSSSSSNPPRQQPRPRPQPGARRERRGEETPSRGRPAPDGARGAPSLRPPRRRARRRPGGCAARQLPNGPARGADEDRE